jgi:hypothetical protein
MHKEIFGRPLAVMVALQVSSFMSPEKQQNVHQRRAKQIQIPEHS